MKALLCKELRLAAHPTLFLFTAFGALVLVPNYPYGAVFLFGCLACMITFQYGRETNDVLFSALLPVTRGQIVAARLVTVCAMQLCQLVLSLPFAFLRVRLFPQGKPFTGVCCLRTRSSTSYILPNFTARRIGRARRFSKRFSPFSS